MTEVEKWMLKHYTQDLDSIKCNYCQEIFSDCNRMQNFKYHLRNMHNVLELDEHPECDNIQKNYKISSPMATCNHCKKTINLAIHGVHVLTIHLKIFHKDKIKISHLRDKYDITDNKATCKRCKKTLKISTCTSLRRHLYYCGHFKIDFLDKKKLNKGITKKIERKRSYIWDKYDVMGSNVTCKGCKKTLKIKITSPHAKVCLRSHLLYCPYFKIDFLGKKKLNKGITKKIKRKRSYIWDKYDIISNNATCKGCKKTLKIKITSPHATGCLRKHLHNCPHFKINFPRKKEITKRIRSRRSTSHIWDKYDVTDNNNATCKGCKKTLKTKTTSPHAIKCLRQHLLYCPHFKIDFPRTKTISKEITQKRSHIWDKYDMTDSSATCKGCKKILKIKNNKNYTAKSLRQHLYHCSHFKIDFPLKKEITFEITRKKSHPWDKYDITDNNNATCKGCKKTLKVKLTSIHAETCLRRHLHRCSENEITKQIKEKKRSHVWDKYDVMGSNATCKGCKKIVKIPRLSKAATLLGHLHYCPHFSIDYQNEKHIPQKRSHPWDKYDITDNNVTCKGCKKTLKVKLTSIHAGTCLRRHLCNCRHFKTDFPRKKEITKQIRETKTSRVWDRYDVMGSFATCKGCKKTIKIARTCAGSTLLRHLRHCQNDFLDKKVNKIIHMIRVECNTQEECEVEEKEKKGNVKRKKKQ